MPVVPDGRHADTRVVVVVVVVVGLPKWGTGTIKIMLCVSWYVCVRMRTELKQQHRLGMGMKKEITIILKDVSKCAQNFSSSGCPHADRTTAQTVLFGFLATTSHG